MTFLHPEFFYLMLPPVLVLFYFILTQKEPAAELFAGPVFERLRVNEKRFSLRQRNLIYLAIFVLLIAAMSQPVLTEATAVVKAPDEALTVAVDISASMQTEDVYPSRAAVAKTKLLALVARAKREQIGVLAFGRDIYAVVPPTADKSALTALLEDFASDTYAEKGTDIMALLAAANGVMGKTGRKNLLLLTDGGDGRDFSEAIAYANAQKLHLYILGIGTAQGGVLQQNGTPALRGKRPVRTVLNPALRSLAASTGGFYVDMTVGSRDVAALLYELRRHAEGGETGVKEIRRYGQLYILPLGLALFLLLVANASMSRRERVAVPPALLLGVLLFGHTATLRAESFDYELLETAQHYYEQGDYDRAARAFYRYGVRKDNDPQAMYDSAHALYRAGRYDAAAALWGRIRTKERLLQFATLHNLGNARAMQGGRENLEAAIKVYQKALYLQNDPQTRENLSIVRGRLMRLVQAERRRNAAAAMTETGGEHSASDASSPAGGAQAPSAQTETSEGQEAKPSEASGEAKTAAMSDYEAAMWRQSLQRQTRTHLYKISPKRAGGGDHVDPW
ncbi:VWA domain-containing protein [Sulfurimonas diazotrophicus]|uniref:VWA domain-containing protein n=1 Tax=Sulfurimonas diazotrophicus TaxID=3131939 RepID=A0ABZ3H867_9BACT